MNKKNKKIATISSIVGGVAIMLLLMFFLGSGEQSVIPPNTSGSGAGTSGTHSGGGGGGGGGSGDSGSGGSTPPAGGFQCDTCVPIFKVGNPGVVVKTLYDPSDIMGGIKPPVGSSQIQWWNKIPGFKPDGHYNCETDVGCVWNGVVQPDYNCVPDPTQEMPENGWDDISGEKPSCWCLKQNPGSCAFYDHNFGQGLDDMQCGGSCPVGETCTSFNDGAGKQHCQCKEETSGDCGWKEIPLAFQQTAKMCIGDCPDGEFCTVEGDMECKCRSPENQECGWHDTTPGGMFIDASNQQMCWGACPEGTHCESTFAIFGDGDCLCVPGETQDDHLPCNQIVVDESSWTDCGLRGECTVDGSACIYNPETVSCECKGAGCYLHLTEDQLKEFEGMTYTAATPLLNVDIESYCYGSCLGGCTWAPISDYVWDCRCSDNFPDLPDLTPKIEIPGTDSLVNPPVVINKDIPTVVIPGATPVSPVAPVNPPSPTPWYARKLW